MAFLAPNLRIFIFLYKTLQQGNVEVGDFTYDKCFSKLLPKTPE